MSEERKAKLEDEKSYGLVLCEKCGRRFHNRRSCKSCQARIGMEFIGWRGILGEDITNTASLIYTLKNVQEFSKKNAPILVKTACLYLTCREKFSQYLLIDFSSRLKLSIYWLGSVYLQLLKILGTEEHWKHEKVVDPTIFIVRFSYILFQGTDVQDVAQIARDIIATSWTNQKPIDFCGQAIQRAASQHSLVCSVTEMLVPCDEYVTKKLTEYESATCNNVPQPSYIPDYDQQELGQNVLQPSHAPHYDHQQELQDFLEELERPNLVNVSSSRLALREAKRQATDSLDLINHLRDGDNNLAAKESIKAALLHIDAASASLNSVEVTESLSLGWSEVKTKPRNTKRIKVQTEGTRRRSQRLNRGQTSNTEGTRRRSQRLNRGQTSNAEGNQTSCEF